MYDKILKLIILITMINYSYAESSSFNMRNIKIAGLVVNSENFTPLEGVNIYDENNNILGTTNFQGYFMIEFDYLKDGEIKFKIKLKKEDYQTYIQKEHWGNFNDDVENIMYFGLKKNESSSISFSKLILNNTNLGFENVVDKFKEVKEEQNLINRIEILKKGNDNVFFKINNNFYLISCNSWVLLNHEDDLISVNDKIIKASELNFHIKRKDIRGMSPIESEVASFIIKI